MTAIPRQPSTAPAASSTERDAQHHYKAAVMHHQRGELDAAERAYRQALAIRHDFAAALENLGVLLAARMDHAGALGYLEQALALTPQSSQLLANLCEVARAAGDFERALDFGRRAVTIAPNSAQAHRNLSVALHRTGQPAMALVHAQHACRYAPRDAAAHSALLLAMHYLDEYSPDAIFAEHRRWNEQHGGPSLSTPQTRPAAARRRERLRIGYVSADLRNHSVAYFIEPILAHHNHTAFEIYAYSAVAQPDAVTQRLRSHCDSWRDISGLSDEAVATQIRTDEIDILVDLAGHSSGNRLGVFARKPAPIQVTYLGYPDTTGLAAMDYRITDAWADPPGRTEQWHSERLVRLAGGFLCYQPPAHSPDVSDLPARRNGYITFGSFNNLAKFTPQTLALWAEILRRTPNSRLILKAIALEHQGQAQKIIAEFVAQGIAADRIRCIGLVPDGQAFLALYNEVDIALDTFPYHGTTTTCDALWMGVPVVSRAGVAHVSRVSVSLLEAVGLSDWIANTAHEYVQKAVALAGDLNYLENTRRQLRPTMRSSRLMNAHAKAQELEAAFRKMAEPEDAATQISPDRSIAESRGADAEATLQLALPNGVKVRVPNSIHDLSTYVLIEQPDWNEPELAFVRRYLRPEMSVFDFGAGPGVYALSAAAMVDPKGHVVAFDEEPGCRALLSSAARDNGFAHFDVQPLPPLDTELRIAGFDNVALVRIGAGVSVLDFVAAAHENLVASAPLVMAFLPSNSESLNEAVAAFAAIGYSPYVLVPGLQQLAPLSAELDDPYRLNRFFCKPKRIENMRAAGLISSWLDAAATRQATPSSDAWLAHLLQLTFANGFADLWNKSLARPTQAAGWVDYNDALNLYVAAHAAYTPSEQRFALLAESLNALARAIELHANASRLQTLARIAQELGLRKNAVQALDTLRQLFAADAPVDVSEPFLPVSAPYDMIDPGQSPGRWCLTAILAEYERLASFTSFFAGESELNYYRQLARANLLAPDLERRAVLLALRLESKAK